MKNIIFSLNELTKKPILCLCIIIQLTVSFIAIFTSISITNTLNEKSIDIKNLLGSENYYIISTHKSKSLSEESLDSLIKFQEFLKNEDIILYLAQTDSIFINKDDLDINCLANFDTRIVDNKVFHRAYLAYTNNSYISDIGIKLSEGNFSSENELDVPIVLGDDYKNIFNISDKIPYLYTQENGDEIIKYYTVTGFIEKDEYLCVRGNPDEITNLNNYVIVNQDIGTPVNNSSEEMVIKINIYNYITNSYLNFKNSQDIQRVEERSLELGLNYSLTNMNDILETFNKEISGSLVVIKAFSLSILLFTVVSLIMVMLNMVIKCTNEFGINMMVGASLSDILQRIFFQVGILFFISIVSSIFIIWRFVADSNMININIVNIMQLITISIVISILVSIIPIIKFKRTSINNIIRGSEYLMLELRNVNKIYGKGEAEVKALQDINLKINDGELVAIIGSSGSGKSTLLNIMGGIDKCSSGEYYLDNKLIVNLSDKVMARLRNEKFGFVLQYFGLINDYTVLENVCLPLKYTKIKNRNRKEIVKVLLAKMNIENKINSYPSELSGGQCQRVAIARALVNNPEIIFADEPTGALDKKTGDQILDFLIKLNKEGKTVVIVSHDINIYSKCTRIIELEDGYIKEDTL